MIALRTFFVRLGATFLIASVLVIFSLSSSKVDIYSKYAKASSQDILESVLEIDSINDTLPEAPPFQWCPDEADNMDININCDRIIAHDKTAIEQAKQWKSPCSYNDSVMRKIVSDCDSLKSTFPFYSERYRSADTIPYPLAFVIIGARKSEQMVRLLQTLYHPQNVYCLTYDNKSSTAFKETLHSLDKCYDNIIMPESFYNVYWGGYSILQTAMNCLKALRGWKKKWNYVQIVSWNDFPLRTNKEMTQIFRVFNGTQDSDMEPAWPSRTYKYFVEHADKLQKNRRDPEKVKETKSIPPADLFEYKGSLATSMTREFVDFIFENKAAIQYYEWLNTSFCAEEVYWSTLIHNLHINPPGGFPGTCLPYYDDSHLHKGYVSRYQIWETEKKCKGKITFWSCVFGIGDLPRLNDRYEIMAHKLYLDYQPALYYCLAHQHYNRTFYADKYQDYFDIAYYENLPAVQYSRIQNKDLFIC